MNRHSTAHSGRLVTGSGDALDIELELIGGRTLRMSAAGDELGAWPLEECRVVPESHDAGSFRIVVDGDDVSFTPVDVPRFLTMVDSWALLDVGESRAEVTDTWVTPVESVSGIELSAPDQADNPEADPDTSLFLFGSGAPPQPADVLEPALDSPEEDSQDDPVDAISLPFGDDDSGDVVLEVERSDSNVAPSDIDQLAGDVEFGVDRTDFGGSVEGADEIDTLGPLPVFDREQLSDVDPGDLPSAEDLERDVRSRADWAIPPAPSAGSPPASAADSGGTDETDGEADRLSADPATVVPEEDGAEFAVDLPPRGDELEEASDVRARLAGSSAERLVTAIGAFTSKRSEEDGEEFVLGPNTVAEDVITSQRVLRDHRQESIWAKSRIRNALVAGSVVGALVLLALMAPMALDFIRTYEGGRELPPTLPVVATTVVVATTLREPDSLPTTTAVAPTAGDTILDRPSPEFVSRWNMIGGEIDQVLEFDAFPILGPFEERFTPYLRMVGEVRPDGTMREFALIIDPSGPAQYDRIGIQALGVAIATVDPSRSPEGRATLLGNLGLNVRRPTLGAIDGSLESNGLMYTLLYEADVSLLTFTVSSGG